MVNLYPLLFTPIYKEMIWGGNRLETMYKRIIPSGKTGESWDISCRTKEMGIIENGPAAGMSFIDYISQDKTNILGTRLADNSNFPLLVKIIDANDTLSVQVHPSDGYTSEPGKSEMWYILNPPTNGELIIGLKPGITASTLRQAYENGTIESCLSRLHVKSGDIVNIPAGLVHALTPGVIVAEVQQNSDITYRLYDYNRKDPNGNTRQLHIDDALAVTDFTGQIPKSTVLGLPIKKGENNLVYHIANKHFGIIKYELRGKLEETSDPAAFSIFTCVEGEADIMGVHLPVGRSVFIPAGLGTYNIHPKQGRKCTLLKSFVPDIESDFMFPLANYGYTNDEINKNVSITIDSSIQPAV